MAITATASIIRAVQIANGLREMFDLPLLSDLPKGKIRNAKHCILARAFNFDCEVRPLDRGSTWRVSFKVETEKAEAFVDWALTNSLKCTTHDLTRKRVLVIVTLPDEIAQIARSFDTYRLPEYVE